MDPYLDRLPQSSKQLVDNNRLLYLTLILNNQHCVFCFYYFICNKLSTHSVSEIKTKLLRPNVCCKAKCFWVLSKFNHENLEKICNLKKGPITNATARLTNLIVGGGHFCYCCGLQGFYFQIYALHKLLVTILAGPKVCYVIHV